MNFRSSHLTCKKQEHKILILEGWIFELFDPKLEVLYNQKILMKFFYVILQNLMLDIWLHLACLAIVVLNPFWALKPRARKLRSKVRKKKDDHGVDQIQNSICCHDTLFLGWSNHVSENIVLAEMLNNENESTFSIDKIDRRRPTNIKVNSIF